MDIIFCHEIENVATRQSNSEKTLGAYNISKNSTGILQSESGYPCSPKTLIVLYPPISKATKLIANH